MTEADAALNMYFDVNAKGNVHLRLIVTLLSSLPVNIAGFKLMMFSPWLLFNIPDQICIGKIYLRIRSQFCELFEVSLVI